MRISCIILARGGSKGIPKKNIVDFCGKPLISWTILQALKAEGVSDVWVSSDSKEILEVATHYGANAIVRPKEISGDFDSSESAWMHAIDLIEQESSHPIDYVLAPQATSPLRHSRDFSNAIKQIQEERADSLLSVAEVEDFFLWKKGHGSVSSVNYDYKHRKPRQKIDKTYLENGSFYLFRPQLLRDECNRLGGKISLFKMDRYKMFQIDNIEDIELSSVIMRGFGLSNL